MGNSTESVLTVQPYSQAIVAVVRRCNLDNETSQQMKRELDSALAAAPNAALILDLTYVEFLPSLAIGMLVSTHKALQQAGRKCVLVGIQRFVLESIQFMGLDRYFAIGATVDDGLKQVGDASEQSHDGVSM